MLFQKGDAQREIEELLGVTEGLQLQLFQREWKWVAVAAQQLLPHIPPSPLALGVCLS